MKTEKIKKIYKDMDLQVWKNLCDIKKCLYCKKFKEPFYIEENGAKLLNPNYLIHVQQTHGIPAYCIVEEIADTLYKTEDAKNKMLKFYKFLDN